MHRFRGPAALAATGILVLLLAGCGSSDDAAAPPATVPSRTAVPKGGAVASAGPGSQVAHPPSPAAGSGPGAQTVESVATKLAGTWQGETDGSVVTLSVKGVQAAVIADGHVCQGTIQDMGVPMLAMSCTDGDKNRVMGIVQSNDGGTAVIAWGDTKRDTVKKTTIPASVAPSLPSDGKSPASPSAGPTAS